MSGSVPYSLRPILTAILTEPLLYDERKLLLALAAGDEAAYKSLYLHYYDTVSKFVLKYVKSPELARDLAQDIFIKIWEKRDKLPGVQHFQPYLLQISRNQAIDTLRAAGKSDIVKREIARHFHDHPGFFEDEALQKDYRLFIRRTIDALPPRSREVFLLCREQAKSYEEVAAALGISRNAVRNHMVQALQRFRSAAETEFGGSLGVLLPLLALLREASGH
jgi:RNA polymerase sigma-70 factor (family 1)